jgi:predicted transposase/invertase (TIGR01784 family)
MPVSVNQKMLPKYYIAFQWLFSTPGHEDLTRHFLEDMLESDDIGSVNFITPYNIKVIRENFSDPKKWTYTVADLVAKHKNGTITLIELQRYNHCFMPERILAELASKYGDQAHTGKNMSEKYSGYSNVIGLVLLDKVNFRYGKSNSQKSKLVEHYGLMELDDHYLYPADSSIWVNVIKLDEKLKATSKNIYYWVHFLLTGEVLDEAPAYIKEAHRMLEEKQWTDEEKEIQRIATKSEAIGRGIIAYERNEAFNKGEQKGLKQGLNQGAQDQKIQIAKNLFEMGLSLEQISKGTGLSIDQIKELTNNHRKYSKN